LPLLQCVEMAGSDGVCVIPDGYHFLKTLGGKPKLASVFGRGTVYDDLLLEDRYHTL